MSWDEQAAQWVWWARASDDTYWRYRDAFFALVPQPGERTIEIGCGEGRVSRDLVSRGHRVVGVDSAPALVVAAQKADPRGDYVVADAASLPFPDESFDIAVAYNSLMDIDDIDGAIREAVATEHELAIHKIVLIRPGNLPKTTSGKIQRGLARRLFLDGRLAELEPALPDAPA